MLKEILAERARQTMSQQKEVPVRDMHPLVEALRSRGRTTYFTFLGMPDMSGHVRVEHCDVEKTMYLTGTVMAAVKKWVYSGHCLTGAGCRVSWDDCRPDISISSRRSNGWN